MARRTPRIVLEGTRQMPRACDAVADWMTSTCGLWPRTIGPDG